MTSTRFYLFFLVIFALLGALNRYLWRRSTTAFAAGPRVRRGTAAVLAGSLVLIALSRVLEGRVPPALLEPVAAVGFTVVLGSAIAAVLLILLDLLAAAARLPARLRRAPAAPPATAPAADPPAAARLADPPDAPVADPPAAPRWADPPALPRRTFLAQAAAGSALAVGGGSSVYGTWLGRHDYALEEVPVRIPGLGRALDGFTVVQLSDVHLGLFVREREILAAEELVRRARPDLIVLTGDLLDHDARQAETLGRMVTRLAALCRGGVVAIPGNHDYYAGIDAVRDAVTRAGARYLVNEGMMVGGEGGFALLGVDDVMGPRSDARSRGPDLAKALATVPAAQDRPRVLLCHNPSTFPRFAPQVALQLSGHTHGGQINLGVRLADTVLGHPYIAGRYTRGESQIYVNRGFGTAGPPARVGAPPEVTRVVLVAG
jgi:hypothetical protein